MRLQVTPATACGARTRCGILPRGSSAGRLGGWGLYEMYSHCMWSWSGTGSWQQRGQVWLSVTETFLFGQEDAALYRHLGTLLRHCVMLAAAGDRTEEFHG